MFDDIAPRLPPADFERVLELGEAMAKRAGTDTSEPKFSSEPSRLPLASSFARPDTAILTVDIGGTHTRVGLRQAGAGGETGWTELLDVDNDELDTGGSAGKALGRMVKELVARIGGALEGESIDRSHVLGVGVVWSNNLRCVRLDPDQDGLAGVTATAIGVADETSYRKGEWFNADLADGDDVGAVIYGAFRSAKFPLKAFVIGNDTVFTCKAAEHADAGLVASTGANGTIIPCRGDLAGELCNAESGGGFEVPQDMLSAPDILGQDRVKLEDLMAGIGMAPRFTSHIKHAASTTPALVPCAEFDDYTNIEVSQLVNRDLDGFVEDRPAAQHWEKESLAALTSIAEGLMRRGGKLAAALAYFSICNQIESKEEFIVSVDSSLCRHNPLYFQTMEGALNAILQRRSRHARIDLLEPLGNISVPHMGAARAVNDFLA